MKKWISVSEKMPDERIRVLTTDGRSVETGFYGRGSHNGCYKPDQVMWRRDHGDELPFTNLDMDVEYARTHWMDLPDVSVVSENSLKITKMKETLIKLLDAITERIKPCGHNWERWETTRCSDDWGATWSIFHLKCTRCGKLKKVKSS